MAEQKTLGTTLTFFFSSYSREQCFLKERVLHLQGLEKAFDCWL